MTRTPITANKTCLLSFTKRICTYIAERYDITNEKHVWKDKWIRMKKAGLGEKKFSRFRLAKEVLGTATEDKSISNIIKCLRKTFPFDEQFNFIPTNDSDLWHIDDKELDESTKKEPIFTGIPGKESTSTTSYASIITNPIKPNEDSEIWTQVTKTGNKGKTPVPLTIPDTASPIKNENQFQGFQDFIENDEMISYNVSTDNSLEQKSQKDESKSTISSKSSSHNTDLNDNKNNKNQEKATSSDKEIIEKINKLRNQGLNLTKHADLDEILIWIESKTTNLDKIAKSKINEIENTSKTTLQQLYHECEKATNTSNHANNISNGIYDKLKKEKANLKSETLDAKTDAITSVNMIANRRKAEINGKMEELEKLLIDVNAIKSVPSDCLKEINNTIEILKGRINKVYDEFEDTANTMVDDQKANFRNWLDKLMGNNTMKSVHDLIEETENLKASRMLLDTKRKEIDNWFHDQKEKYQQLKMQQPYSTMVPPTPPFKPDDAIKYTKDLYNVYGYIMKNKTFKNEKWYFEIFTMNGTTIHDCCEDNIQLHEDNIPPDATTTQQSPIRPADHQYCQPITEPPLTKSKVKFPYSPLGTPTIKQESFDSSNDPRMNKVHHQWHPSLHQRQPAQNEFQYPLGSIPLSVNLTNLIKHAEKWKFELTSELELRGFYDSLKNFFQQYNIYIKNYNDIHPDEGLELITPSTCNNFEVAKAQMSQAIMTFFQNYSNDIFKDYTAPLDYIAAFTSSSNGLGYLKRIMKRRHPRLKDVINRKTPATPQFKNYRNIHIFIQAYIEWLHDERLRGGREYDDKEQLDHALNNLDERFNIAIDKIETKLVQLYSDPHDPQAIPSHLKVTSDLGIYITDLIPDNKTEDLTNNVPKLHAMNTRSKYRNQPKNDKEATPRYRNSQQSSGENEANSSGQLEWKILPGAICPACKKNNHNVYRTGCPSLGLFAQCKEFYDSQPKHVIDKVKNSFQSYQRELGKKMKLRRNKDRHTLRTVAATYGNEEMGALKDVLFEEYKNDFNEEQYLEENPYEDFYYDENELSDEDENKN